MIKMDYTYPDFQKLRENIHADGNINYFDTAKFMQLITSYAAREQTCINNLRTAEGIMLGYHMLGSDRDSVKDGLVACGIPQKMFTTRKTKSGFSLDAEKIDTAKDYIEKTPNIREATVNAYNYLVWHSEKALLSTTLSRATGALKSGMIQKSENVYGWDGNLLLEVGNIYNQRVTGRFYPKNLSITSLPLAIRQCLVAPDGTFLAAFDFRQIDFEVLYNVFLRGYNKEEDAIYDAEPEDKYHAMYKIICLRDRIPIEEEEYKRDRADIKTAILAAGYGARVNTLMANYKNAPFCKALVSYYENNEGYSKIISKVVTLMGMGISFRVKDYFGFELDIPVKENIPGVGEFDLQEEQVIKYVVSYIVQSTSNSIYTKWVNYVMSEFERVGCKDHITVALSVFDEAVLCLDGKAIDYFYILRNAQRISISDWSPIRLKQELFIHYKEDEFTYPDEEQTLKGIEDTINIVCAENKDKIVKDMPKGERHVSKMIPTLHTIFIASTDGPKEILKNYFGLHNGDIDFMSDLEAVNKVTTLASQTGLTGLEEYSKIYDRFVLVNGDSGTRVKCYGINSLPNLLEKYGIQYVQVNTIIGDGFTNLGPACGMKSSLQGSMVYEELTSGDWSVQ